MVKFLALAVSALLTFASVQATPAQDEARIPCAPVNFQNKTVDFLMINQLVQVAIGSGLLANGLKKVDPLTIVNKRLDALPFSVLGTDFELTPVIKQLNVTGLATVIPHAIDVKSPKNLGVGVDFNGTVAVSSTLSFEIAQLNKQWWQICWTNILHPKRCPAKVIDVELGAGVNKPSINTNVLISMLQCDPMATNQGNCKDLTVNDIITAALSQQFDGLLTRVLLRLSTISIEEMTLAFQQITKLQFHFPTSGPLLTSLGKKLLNFTTSEINKKGDFYKTLIDVMNKLIKTLGNQLIQQKIQSKFGNTCYDV